MQDLKLLPWKEKRINGVNVKCDFYKPKDFQKTLALCQKSVTDSTGLGIGEFQNAQYLQKYLSNSKAAVTFYDQDNGALILFVMLFDAPLARSSSPLSAGGYIILDKQYRGRKLRGAWGPFFDQLTVNLGYPTTVARNALTATTVFINIKLGACFTAAIPKAINMHGLGWMTDLVVYRNLSRMLTADDWKKVSLLRFYTANNAPCFLYHW